VPGLDDAAAAWYDLEGIEPPQHEDVSPAAAPAKPIGNLPFGFQGESNIYDSQLPFGIGSFAEGIPFDNAGVNSVDSKHDEPATVTPQPTPLMEPEPQHVSPSDVDASPLDDDSEPAEALPVLPALDLPELSSSEPTVSLIHMDDPPSPPQPPAPLEAELTSEPVRLTSARLVVESPVQEEVPVPDYWKIDAPIPDYEEIYGEDSTVVHMEYSSLDDDVVVYDHTTDSPATVFHSPLEATPASPLGRSIKLNLHSVQALNVDVGGSTEMQEALRGGFEALQRGDWSTAARAFQRMAAEMPTNAEVYNNYGISLLQRATAMRDSGDPQQESVAETQFESSILALREAAKNAPTNGDVLVNLAIALVESGRSEKALGIMNVHNARTKGSAKGLNTAAVAMFNLGQLTQAVETFGQAGDDPVAIENLSQLSPNRS
tara:strand:- start:651 stop:1946 length:1296 start_codon:yes stop_codon:yes gene_type:complete